MTKISQATVGQRQNFLTASEYQQIYQAADKQARMLAGLRHLFSLPKTLNPQRPTLNIPGTSRQLVKMISGGGGRALFALEWSRFIVVFMRFFSIWRKNKVWRCDHKAQAARAVREKPVGDLGRKSLLPIRP